MQWCGQWWASLGPSCTGYQYTFRYDSRGWLLFTKLTWHKVRLSKNWLSSMVSALAVQPDKVSLFQVVWSNSVIFRDPESVPSLPHLQWSWDLNGSHPDDVPEGLSCFSRSWVKSGWSPLWDMVCRCSFVEELHLHLVYSFCIPLWSCSESFGSWAIPQ